MLVLGRRQGENIRIGDDIKVIVLEVRGTEPGTVSIERVRLSYRDRLQWATQFAGSPALVTIISP